MKKIIFTSTALLTLLAIGVCKGADVPNAPRNLFDVMGSKRLERRDRIELSGRQIADMNIPESPQDPQNIQNRLRFFKHLNLANNQIQAIPDNFTPPIPGQSHLKHLQ